MSLLDLKDEMQAMGLQCAWTLAAEAADHKETLAINARIATDPEARAAWLQHQAVIDPVPESAEQIELGDRSPQKVPFSPELAHTEEGP